MKYTKQLIKIILLIFIIFWIGLFFTKKSLVSEQIISFLPQIISLQFSITFLTSLVIIYKKWKFSLILAVLNWIIIILNIISITTFYHVKKNTVQGNNTLKILSVNLLYENTEYEGIKNLVNQTNPDVLILLEFSENHYLNLGDFLMTNYPYVSESASFYGENLIYSKYKIENNEYTKLSNDKAGYNSVIINFNNSDYKIYAVHTAAPINQYYFEQRNLFLDDLSKDLLNENTEKIVAAGDFNLTPWSYYYKNFDSQIDNKFQDISSSKGVIYTWYMLKFLPVGNHIDHMFVSKNINFRNFEVYKLAGSDHLALYAELY